MHKEEETKGTREGDKGKGECVYERKGRRDKGDKGKSERVYVCACAYGIREGEDPLPSTTAHCHGTSLKEPRYDP